MPLARTHVFLLHLPAAPCLSLCRQPLPSVLLCWAVCAIRGESSAAESSLSDRQLKDDTRDSVWSWRLSNRFWIRLPPSKGRLRSPGGPQDKHHILIILIVPFFCSHARNAVACMTAFKYERRAYAILPKCLVMQVEGLRWSAMDVEDG